MVKGCGTRTYGLPASPQVAAQRYGIAFSPLQRSRATRKPPANTHRKFTYSHNSRKRGKTDPKRGLSSFNSSILG